MEMQRKENEEELNRVHSLTGVFIRKARMSANLRQSDLALLLGITQVYLSKLERGKCRWSLVRFINACRVLEIPRTEVKNFLSKLQNEVIVQRGSHKS